MVECNALFINRITKYKVDKGNVVNKRAILFLALVGLSTSNFSNAARKQKASQKSYFSLFSMPSFSLAFLKGKKKKQPFVLNSEQDAQLEPGNQLEQDSPLAVAKKKKSPSAIMQHLKNGFTYLKSDDSKNMMGTILKYGVPIAIACSGGYYMHKKDQRNSKHLNNFSQQLSQQSQQLSQQINTLEKHLKDHLSESVDTLASKDQINALKTEDQINALKTDLANINELQKQETKGLKELMSTMLKDQKDLNSSIVKLADMVHKKDASKGICRPWDRSSIRWQFKQAIKSDEFAKFSNDKKYLDDKGYRLELSKPVEIANVVRVTGSDGDYLCANLTYKKGWKNGINTEEWANMKQLAEKQLRNVLALTEETKVVVIGHYDTGKEII